MTVTCRSRAIPWRSWGPRFSYALMALFSKEISEAWKSSGVLSIKITYFSYVFIASAISGLKVSAVTAGAYKLASQLEAKKRLFTSPGKPRHLRTAEIPRCLFPAQFGKSRGQPRQLSAGRKESRRQLCYRSRGFVRKNDKCLIVGRILVALKLEQLAEQAGFELIGSMAGAHIQAEPVLKPLLSEQTTG